MADSFWHTIIENLYNTSVLEWVGVISGFACIYLAAKQHLLNWPISIISVIAYAIVFYDAGLYGEIILQVYFLFTAIYGWYYWKKVEDDHLKPVRKLTAKEMMIVIVAVLVQWAILALFLKNFTDTNVPYADGFCVAMSFTAQFLMTRKIIDNWIMWIIVDICYVPLFIYKGLDLTALLYAVLVILAFIGYFDWRRDLYKQTQVQYDPAKN